MQTISQIALTFTPGLGNTSIRRLIELYPDEDIFSLPKSELKTAFGTHQSIVDNILNKNGFPRAEDPERLNRPEADDCPALLYVLGSADLNSERAVSIVGTRRATAYGRDNTDRLVRELKPYNTPIVSGLAYGIDTAAHTAALEHQLPTVAVLGHGLDQIYPAENRPLAKRILEAGGALVTEYPSGTAINPRFFPARNRIIAALSDASVVVEASEKGGALITAAIAASYQREVFALPGRITDTYSRGTNNLIASNRALLLRNADDIAFQLGWPIQGQQTSMNEIKETPKLSSDEQKIVNILKANNHMTLDEIATAVSHLFNLEMNKVVHTLPGHLYQIIS